MSLEALKEMWQSAWTRFNYADTPLLVEAAIFEMLAAERRMQEAEEEMVLGGIGSDNPCQKKRNSLCDYRQNGA